MQHKVRLTQNPPLVMAAVAGDAIGALRASLDLAVCACGLIEGRTDLRNTYFHFASDEKKWDETVAGKTKSAPKKVVEAMRAFRPWNGGDDLLYGLSRAAVTDKHQLLLPIGSFSPGRKQNTQGIGYTEYIGVPGNNWNDERNESVYLITGPNDKVQQEVEFRFFIAFREPVEFKRKAIVPTLTKTLERLRTIVSEFEGIMGARR